MERFIRFQTPLRCRETGRQLGVFHAAGRIEGLPETCSHVRDCLAETLGWFNKRLKYPLLGEHGWRSVFWFRADAQEMVSRIWDLVAIVREEGIAVSIERTTNPGRIIYLDRHQIAAVPWRRPARQRPCLALLGARITRCEGFGFAARPARRRAGAAMGFPGAAPRSTARLY